MKKILIVGGSGYLGAGIVNTLVQLNEFQVIVGSRCVYQSSHPNISYCQIDLSCNGTTVDELSNIAEGVDTIVHLASLDDKSCRRTPVIANDVNVSGVIKMLQAAKLARVKRFMYFSTAHVYGAPLHGKLDESSETRPMHEYAITHRSAEDYVYMEHLLGNIEGIIFRLSNGFGAPVDRSAHCWHLIVNDVSKQAIINKAIKLHSCGKQYRDFICKTDIERAVYYFLKYDEKISEPIINLGSGKVNTILEMAELVANRASVLLGDEILVRVAPKKEGESYLPLDYNVNKLNSLGFYCHNDFSSEIDKLLNFCRESFECAIEE